MPLDTVDNSEKDLKKERFKNFQSALAPTPLSPLKEASFVEMPHLDSPEKYEDYIDLDSYNVFKQDINKERAVNQGNFRQFAYGTAGGIAKGALHAIAGAANLLDFEAHLNQLQGINDTEQNWLAEIANSGAEAVGEALPIYQEDPSKVFDFSDGASYYKAWEGLVDSAVQFAAPGGLITKGIGAAMRGGKMAQWIAQLATKSPTLAKIVETTPAALVMNKFESGIMAYETAKEVKGELIAARDKGELEITDEEIEDRAQEAFNYMTIANLAFLPITGLQTMGIAKGVGSERNLLKDRSTLINRFKNFGSSLVAPNADNLIVQGLGEAGEEIAQGVMSGESKYQALKGTGTEKGSENFLDRVIEYGTSDQALLEGAMGFLGGGVQRVMMEGITGQYSKTAREEYNKRYAEQQAFMEKMKDFTTGKAKLNAEAIQQKEALLKEGKTIEADLIDKQMFQNLVQESFKLGTMEMVENQLKDLAEGKLLPDQSQYLGEDAQAKASEMLREAKELEQLWLKYSGSPIGTELFNNRVTKKNHSRSLDQVNNAITDFKSTIGANVARQIVPLLDATKRGETLPYNIDGVIDAAVNDIRETLKTRKQVSRPVKGDDFNKLVEGVKGTEEFERYLELVSLQKQLVNSVNSLDKEYAESTTTKGFKKAIENKQVEFKTNEKLKELYKNNQKEKVTQAPSKGDVILNKFNQAYKVEGFNTESGKVILSDLSGKRLEMSSEKFLENFRNTEDGTYTKFINKEIISERKTQASKKNNQSKATQGSPEDKVNKAEASNTTAQTEEEEMDTIPTTSPGETTKTSAEVIIGSVNDNALGKVETLAWSSFNNIDEKNPNRPISKEAEDISEYLENPVNTLIGTRVKLEKDPDNEFSETAIKATLIDQDGNAITHKGTPIVLYVREKGILRGSINSILESEGVAYTTITDKTPGYIQWDKVSPPSKLNEAIPIPVKDMEFRVQTLHRFVDGTFTEEQANYDADLGEFALNKADEGQVVVKVKTANGKPFPLRLTVNTVSEAEAEVIYQMYKQLLNTSNIVDVITDENLLRLIKDLPISKFLNLKEVKFKDVFKLVTNQGDDTASFPMYYKDHVLYFGKDDTAASIPLEALLDPQAEVNAKRQFKDWLTQYKTKNVNWRLLNNNTYKEYLVNDVVVTKARYNANGIIFAQPAIAVDVNVQLTNVSNQSSQVKPKNTSTQEADIERRRQEELDNTHLYEYDRKFKEFQTYGSTVKEAFDNLFEEVKNNPTNKELSDLLDYISVRLVNEDIQKGSGKNPLVQEYIDENQQSIEKASKSDKSRIGKINAKYDAELAALGQSSKLPIEHQSSNKAINDLLGVSLVAQEEESKVQVEPNTISDNSVLAESFNLSNRVKTVVGTLMSREDTNFMKIVETVTTGLTNDDKFWETLELFSNEKERNSFLKKRIIDKIKNQC